jgi:hypothetical protein
MLINWQLVFYGTDTHPLSDEGTDANVPSMSDVEADEEERML